MLRSTFCIVVVIAAARSALGATPDFGKEIQPLLTKYCAGCHNADEANGEFALHDFESLVKGGDGGAVFIPGKPGESRIIALMERTQEPAMPPDGEVAPTTDEIALIKAWIAAGAIGPKAEMAFRMDVPSIKPTAPIRRSIHAAGWSADGSTLALGRYEAVELLHSNFSAKKKIQGLAGQINAVAFLPNNRLMAAGGEAGIAGEVGVWDFETGEADWRVKAHNDAIMCGAINSAANLIATGSYDQSIILWDAASGEQRSRLTGHNGPVLGLAFHPTKPILASASGDRTIKLWNTITAERLDTLTEPTKDQQTIAFSPDGSELASAGADNRIRIWSIGDGKAGTNPIRVSHFAHEAPIIAIAYSRDGRIIISAAEDQTVKFWDAQRMTQVGEPRPQPDWVKSLAVSPEGQVFLGRLDGSSEVHDVPVPGKPSVTESDHPLSASLQGLARLPREQPETAVVVEAEPNHEPANATPLSIPATATGVLDADRETGVDTDCFRFTAQAGEAWIFETNAARSQSSADTKIDILHANGTPVERVQLKAVRDSAVNFRGFSAVNPGLRVDYWEEMELNEYMYLSGEVCRIYRMPQGPDSDMQLYAVDGKRRSYFDTTPVAHALFEPVYIVEPHPPGVDLPANGLPIFSLPYENDDDSEGKLGRDSKLTFTAPTDGDYIIRVRDARGFSGPDFTYQLSARPPSPDFEVTIVEKERTIPAGGGQRLTLRVDRRDGFDGAITVDCDKFPAGLEASFPLVVEAGHVEGKVSITATPEAASPTEENVAAITIKATAVVDGQTMAKKVEPFSKLTVGDTPKIIARLLAAEGGEEITLHPGGRVKARLVIERNGYDDGLNFEIENLPHGVIVDHIGLNGVLVRTDETEREIELYCAEWVQDTSREIFAVGKGQGDPASSPILLKVEGQSRKDLANLKTTESSKQ